MADSTAPRHAGDSKWDDAGGFIAADVGGTFARLGLAVASRDGVPQVVGQRKYACAEFPSLAAVLRRFVQELEVEGLGPAPISAVVAIAGVLQDDTLLNSNLPWPVSLAATQREAGLEQVQLINDFQALAWALPQLPSEQMMPLHGACLPVTLPALLLGPGTGLGAALVVPEGIGYRVLPSEAGHAALGAGNALELDILRGLQLQFEHVDNERILSGTGLVQLYAALCQQQGQAPRWQTPAEVVAAADAGGDPLAEQCLDVFCGWLGSLAGDLAISFCAGTVYLAGGITGHIGHHLTRGAFMRRFLAKGVLAPALQQVPVFCIEHGWLGIVGAAAWYQAHVGQSASAP